MVIVIIIIIVKKSSEEFCAEELQRNAEKNQKVNLCASKNDPGMRGQLISLEREGNDGRDEDIG